MRPQGNGRAGVCNSIYSPSFPFSYNFYFSSSFLIPIASNGGLLFLVYLLSVWNLLAMCLYSRTASSNQLNRPRKSVLSAQRLECVEIISRWRTKERALRNRLFRTLPLTGLTFSHTCSALTLQRDQPNFSHSRSASAIENKITGNRDAYFLLVRGVINALRNLGFVLLCRVLLVVGIKSLRSQILLKQSSRCM